MTQLPFTFSGFAVQRDVNVSVDPKEFKGLSPSAISKELMKMAKSIDKNISFFPADFDMAADAIIEANAEGQ